MVPEQSNDLQQRRVRSLNEILSEEKPTRKPSSPSQVQFIRGSVFWRFSFSKVQFFGGSVFWRFSFIQSEVEDRSG